MNGSDIITNLIINNLKVLNAPMPGLTFPYTTHKLSTVFHLLRLLNGLHPLHSKSLR